MDEERPETAGAYDWEEVLEQQTPTPEPYTNPAGVGESACDAAPADPQPCDEDPIEDMVLGESMPGEGIPGFDVEEDGGA